LFHKTTKQRCRQYFPGRSKCHGARIGLEHRKTNFFIMGAREMIKQSHRPREKDFTDGGQEGALTCLYPLHECTKNKEGSPSKKLEENGETSGSF